MSAGIQLKGSTKTISEQKVSAIFQWRGQQKTRFPSVAPCRELIDSVSWVQGFLLSFHQKGFILYTYTNGPIIASAEAQSKLKKQAPQQPQLGA